MKACPQLWKIFVSFGVRIFEITLVQRRKHRDWGHRRTSSEIFFTAVLAESVPKPVAVRLCWRRR